MSIQATSVDKVYGDQKALNNVSFTINKGQIVGFLGPNGAGKSTMMKIITCYIPPSKGEVLVNGMNVMDDPLSVRSKIGYLPEHNPLYLDMYVKEYLQFIGGVHKVTDTKARIAEIIELVGLGREQNKKIGALSKGYRQRVGLASAMFHDPEVLILDEPTTGLDPNQIVDIRQLIKEIGKEKTVLMSTHIMQEVDAICDRVIIIDKGVIVADDTRENIRSSNQGSTIILLETAELVSDEALSLLADIKVESVSSSTYRFSSEKKDLQEMVFNWAVANNVKVKSLVKEEQGLEDVFKRLTKAAD